MEPHDWERAKIIFEEACLLAAGERSTFLARVCGDQPALLHQLESLLAEHDEDPDFLESPALGALSAAPATRAEDRIGMQLGSYRLLGVLGQGGMGTVYLAARADDAYFKQVAVKIIREASPFDGHHRASRLHRFQQERQTLANLDHPGIARLLDGGVTPDQRPYLVMELVEGEPIDTYCDHRQLGVADRLRLFQRVCAPVQFAHQNLVVHRDLKPGNILITRDGDPKLVDFGLAKVLRESVEVDALATLSGPLAMTPAYASPEQIQGRTVTTATDVYSLGVVLYELLTGHRPYSLSGRPPHELAHMICEEEPDPPSSAVNRHETRLAQDGSGPISITPDSVGRIREGTAEWLQRRLMGDLDMIVLMALRKDPRRRYASVEQFSEDIGRHLEGRPVLARGDTLSYRAAKFIRRHRAAVLAAAATVLLLIGATVMTAWSASIANQERDAAWDQTQIAKRNLSRAEAAERRAATKAEIARQVADYLIEVFSVADPRGETADDRAKGLEATAGEILRRGKEQVEFGLKDQPEIQAAMMETLGRVYENLEALNEAETMLRRSLEIRRAAFGPEHPDVATSLSTLGRIVMKKRDFESARAFMQESLEMQRGLFGEEHAAVAESLNDLGTLAKRMGRWEEALVLYQQALDTYGRLAETPNVKVAHTLNNLAIVYYNQNRYGEAEPYYREALQRLRDELGDEHADVATAADNLGALLLFTDQRDEAEQLIREALEIRIKRYGESHPRIAESLHKLASVLHRSGRLDEALPLYGRALDMRREFLGDDHVKVGETLINLANLHYQRGDFERAEPLFLRALEIDRKNLPADHPSLPVSLHNLASVYYSKGRFAQAELLLREAIDDMRRIQGDAHPTLAHSLHTLAQVRQAQGDLQEAETLMRQALAIRISALPDDHALVASSRIGLGAILREKESSAEAESLLRSALDALEESPQANGPVLAAALTELGILLSDTDRADAAEALLRRALDLRRALQPGRPPQAHTASALGACLARRGRFEEAEQLLVDGLGTLEKAYGVGHPSTARTLRNLVQLYERWEKPELAAQYQRQLNVAAEFPAATP